MKHLGAHLRVVEDTVDTRLAVLHGKRGERSLEEYIAQRYPELSKTLPRDLTEEQFAFSDGFAEYAEERLALCAACPTGGGLCGKASEEQTIASGYVPFWNAEQRGIDVAPCKDKWPEYIVRSQLGRAGVDRRLLPCSFATFEPRHVTQERALRTAREFVERFKAGEGGGVILSSPEYGCGKTHLAVALVRALFVARKIASARFEFVPELLLNIKQAFDDYASFGGAIARVTATELLVLDDLGAHRTTDWVREQMLIIANARWNAGLPTIITTNTDAAACRESIGERAYGRLTDGVTGIAMVGPNLRAR